MTADPPASPAGRRSLFEPHPTRLSNADPARPAIVGAHRAALEAGRGGYLDPVTGLFVLTAAEHLRRGQCCAAECRHCPYV